MFFTDFQKGQYFVHEIDLKIEGVLTPLLRLHCVSIFYMIVQGTVTLD